MSDAAAASRRARARSAREWRRARSSPPESARRRRERWACPAPALELPDDTRDRAVLSGLQIGVGLIVESVKLLDRRVLSRRGASRREVGVDRLLPEPDAGEGMRRHVERMRRVRRNRGVAARRVEAARGQRRRVVGVNQIVRDARVVGHLRREPVEDRGGRELILVRLVGRQRRLIERQRIEDARFRSSGHAVCRASPWPARRRRRGCADRRARSPCRARRPPPRTPARAVSATIDAAFVAAARPRQARPAIDTRKWVAPVAHRETPLRHGAGRVGGSHGGEGVGGRAKPERVQQRDRAIEVVAFTAGAQVVLNATAPSRSGGLPLCSC